MSRCKIAERLWGKVEKEAEMSIYTGYSDDLVIASDEYINHIQDHGCWRSKVGEEERIKWVHMTR